MTLPEVQLWQALRANALGGVRFRRQHSFGPYVLDFYAALAKLAVDIDGAAHDVPDQARRDATRDAWLAEQGVRIPRFNAVEVLDANRRGNV